MRRTGPVPGRVGPDPRPASGDRADSRAWRTRRGRRRPARAHGPRVARRARRRRRRRVQPALRRAAVLRRPARRLHERRCRTRAAPSRPAGRRLRRRRGAPGVPPGPADPRAAHPPRQGDVQHLHRPGAARGRRLDVRRLPRPDRAAGDRDPHAPLRSGARQRTSGRRHRGRARAVLRHPHRPGAGPCGRDRRHRTHLRSPAPPRRRRPGRDQHLGEHHPVDHQQRAQGVRGRGHRPRRCRRGDGRRTPGRAASGRPTTSPTTCSALTTARPRCCATCASCRRATTRSTAA